MNMTALELNIARKICERLFGSFDVDDLDRPSSVSAQSMAAARDAIAMIGDFDVHMPNKRIE